MNVLQRNNVTVSGTGPITMVFAHGFGCDQSMWRRLTPHFADKFKVVLLDLVGCGKSDLSAYDRRKYDCLQGHADDMLEVISAVADGKVLFVGHSVSAMIGLLADIKAPERFAGHVMVGPSPCYINEGDYVGGFERSDIESLLETLESNYLGWSSNMAPAIMGAPEQPELSTELTNSFCRTDPEIAKHFARVTFMSDNRADLPKFKSPALLIQSKDDLIAPVAVGEYLHRQWPQSTLAIVDNVGHCPHLSAPGACTDAMEDFIRRVIA
jgi:sigma-B regulation protein RsbQ